MAGSGSTTLPAAMAVPAENVRSSDVMRSFIQRGIENPAQEVTKKGFRMHFVKGIVEDDLPFTFGEGKCMSCCFKYVLPKTCKVPARTMVRHDLGLRP